MIIGKKNSGFRKKFLKCMARYIYMYKYNIMVFKVIYMLLIFFLKLKIIVLHLSIYLLSSIYTAGFTKRLPDGIFYHTIKNKTVDILCTVCCSLLAFIKQNIHLQKKKYLSPKSYMHFLNRHC